MKKLAQVIGMVFLGFLALCIVGIVLSEPSGSSTKSETKTESKPVEKKPVKETSKITKENYDKIKVGDTLTGAGGMTIDEVKAILGNTDNVVETTTTGIDNKEYKMQSMTWMDGVLSTTNISVTFINGKVSGKTFLK
jgi:hypothetical protein